MTVRYGDKEFWRNRYDLFWKQANKQYLSTKKESSLLQNETD